MKFLKLKSKHLKYGLVILSMTVLTLVFQNCGEGFQGKKFVLGEGIVISFITKPSIDDLQESIANQMADKTLDPLALLYTLWSPENDIFECFLMGEDCESENNPSYISGMRGISIIKDNNNDILFDSTNEIQGIDMEGVSCLSYYSENGTDECPFRPELFWQNTCESSPCLEGDFQLYIRMHYSPDDESQAYTFFPFIRSLDDARDLLNNACEDIGGTINGQSCYLARYENVDIDYGTCDKIMYQGSPQSDCINILCDAGYHVEGLECVADYAATRTCDILDGQGNDIGDGTEYLINPTDGTYSQCSDVSCNSGYVNYSINGLDSCAKSWLECPVTLGVGRKYFNDSTGQYGNCQVHSCTGNNIKHGTRCWEPTRSCTRSNATNKGRKFFNASSGAYGSCQHHQCNSDSYDAGGTCKKKASCTWRYGGPSATYTVPHGTVKTGNPAYSPSALYVGTASTRHYWSNENWAGIRSHICLGRAWKPN